MNPMYLLANVRKGNKAAINTTHTQDTYTLRKTRQRDSNKPRFPSVVRFKMVRASVVRQDCPLIFLDTPCGQGTHFGGTKQQSFNNIENLPE